MLSPRRNILEYRPTKISLARHLIDTTCQRPVDWNKGPTDTDQNYSLSQQLTRVRAYHEFI